MTFTCILDLEVLDQSDRAELRMEHNDKNFIEINRQMLNFFFFFNFFSSFMCCKHKMIQCFVKIFEWGKYEYWHSKTITILNITLTSLGPTTRRFIKKCISSNKIAGLIMFKWNLGNLCSPYVGWATTNTVQGYFWWILQLSSTHENPGICECQNPPKITLYCNCHSSASMRATKVPKV